MKKLVFIHGPNGVGKSSTCKKLHSRLINSAWIESEWTRQINPFKFTTEIEKMTEQNMTFLLRGYLNLSCIDTIIFNWGLHGKRGEIFERVLKNISDLQFEYIPVIITCSEEANIRRMKRDNRSEERIERGRLIRKIYDDLRHPTIDNTELTINETVDKLIEIIGVKDI